MTTTPVSQMGGRARPLAVIPTPVGDGARISPGPMPRCPHEDADYIAARQAEDRTVAVRRAIELIRDHRRTGYATFVLARSVERQARIEGITGIQLRSGATR